MGYNKTTKRQGERVKSTTVALPFFIFITRFYDSRVKAALIHQRFLVRSTLMKLVSDYFGSYVFDDEVMQKMLSPEIYQTLKRTTQHGRSLDLSVANAVAAAMKDWAVSLGATHFTHRQSLPHLCHNIEKSEEIPYFF